MRSSFYLREKKIVWLLHFFKEHCREVLCRKEKKNKDENVHRYTVQSVKGQTFGESEKEREKIPRSLR